MMPKVRAALCSARQPFAGRIDPSDYIVDAKKKKWNFIDKMLLKLIICHSIKINGLDEYTDAISNKFVKIALIHTHTRTHILFDKVQRSCRNAMK